MSSNTVPIQSKAASANPINWNDPVRASLPLSLKPINWCGRQWQRLTTLDGQNASSKTCQVILRVIPAIFLSLATIFAFVVGFMGSCVSAKPVEYTLVNMQDLQDVIEEDILKLRAAILQHVTSAKVEATLDSFEIPEEIMQALNAEAIEVGEQPLTAKQFKDQIILPRVREALEDLAKNQKEAVKALASKKRVQELKAKQEEKSEASTKEKGVAKTEEKVKPVDPQAKTKEIAPSKDPVKASASVLAFGKLNITIGVNGGMVEVASLVRASNPFQRVVNAFQTATPALSEVVKVAALDGLRTIDSQAIMKKIPAEMMKDLTDKMPAIASLIEKVIPAFVCQKVLPALMDLVEPALFDLSARAKVTQWAQNVSSVKLKIEEDQNKKETMKIIVA